MSDVVFDSVDSAEDREIQTCDFCDEVVPADELRLVGCSDIPRICSACSDSGVTECVDCDELFDSDHGGLYVERLGPVCGGCMHAYTWCGECDEYSRRRFCDECNNCSNCCECDDRSVAQVNGVDGDLLPYDFRPDEFVCRGAGPLFFGVEIEFETTGADKYRSELVRYCYRALGDVVYLKHDGSLENGVEIVAHPQDLGTFREWAELDAVLRQLAEWGCRAWNNHRCGLHVHLTRSAFLSSRHQFAFALFFYRNASAIRSLSGRRDYELDRWASLSAHQGTGGDSVPRLIDKVRRQAYIGDRYTAVNLTNEDTIEIRVFRGSLNPTTVRGAVELCSAVFDFTAELSSADVRDGFLSWDSFRMFADSVRYPNLAAVCARRGV